MLVCGMWNVVCWYVGMNMWYVGMWYVVCWYGDRYWKCECFYQFFSKSHKWILKINNKEKIWSYWNFKGVALQ